MNAEQYQEWIKTVRKGCEYYKDGSQGATWCKYEGITSYCDPHGCAKLKTE